MQTRAFRKGQGAKMASKTSKQEHADSVNGLFDKRPIPGWRTVSVSEGFTSIARPQ